MNLSIITTLLFTLVQLFSYSVCLYEDQIGKFDWHQTYIGKPVDVLLDDTDSSSVVFGTHSDVIAKVKLRDGSISWRQILSGKSDQLNTVLLNDNGIYSVSSNGQIIRCWDKSTGTLKWEEMSYTSDTTGKYVSSSLDDTSIVVMLSDTIYISSSVKGTLFWSRESMKDTQYILHKTIDGVLYTILMSTHTHQLIVQSIELDSGTEVRPDVSITAGWIDTDTAGLVDQCNIIASSLVCYDQISDSLLIHQLHTSQQTSTSLSYLGLDCQSELNNNNITLGVSVLTDEDTGYFTVNCGVYSSNILSESSGQLTLLHTYTQHTLLTLTTVRGKPSAVSLTRVNQTDHQVTVFDLRSKTNVDPVVHVKIAKHHGDPERVTVVTSKLANARSPYYFIIETSDHAVSFVGINGLLWSREEALASIVSVEMIDLPVSETQAKFEDEFGHQKKESVLTMFFNRISTQVAQLHSYITELKRTFEGVHHVRSNVDDEDDEIEAEQLRRDQFNLNKLIVVLTAPGKLIGLYSSTGDIIWRHLIPDLTVGAAGMKMGVKMIVQRTTAHFPHPPEVIVIGSHRHTHNTLVYVFNPINGKPSRDHDDSAFIELDFKLLQVVSTPLLDNQFSRIVLLIDSHFNIHPLPATSDIADRVMSLNNKLFFYIANPDTGIIDGYALRVQTDSTLYTENLWSVNLCSDGSKITHIVPKRPTEHVRSQGRVLGDRSVLYKYLNPNLVVVATELYDEANVANTFSIHLLDVVTGRVVFSTQHKKTKTPVHIVHSENWVVYSFWSAKTRRTEVSALEFYESGSVRNTTVFTSLNPPTDPMVIRQSYILPSNIAALATTITEHGITNKNILFGLEIGAVLSLPKAFLDPRRPIISQPSQREEGLIPYVPELPLATEAVINYNRTTNKIRGIHTGPAGLESTCLVFVYGIDLYYTRVFPSKMFDMLKEDFDYFLISSVLIGLIVAALITRKLSCMKALKRSWR